MSKALIILVCVFSTCYATLTSDDDSYSTGRIQGSNRCKPEDYGIKWILSQRDENYGWGQQTHRAIIAVFSSIHENETIVSPAEKELMINQLEVELSLALLRNRTELPQSELSFYIHALMVVGRNPRDFKGIDVVRLLERKLLRRDIGIHPFTILCLCNAGIINEDYYGRIQQNWLSANNIQYSFNTEMTAITLKAFLCAGNKISNRYENEKLMVAEALANLQNHDGSFGNNFTTSSVVQALKSLRNYDMQVENGRDFLAKQEFSKLIDIYYVEMALRRTPFIKDYFPHIDYRPQLEKQEAKVFVKYTIKASFLPETYLTISMDVPKTYKIFDVMKMAERENPSFNFTYNLLVNGAPHIYSIAGLPNNAEDGIFWRLYKRINNEHDRTSKVKELTERVNEITVYNEGDFVFQYQSLFSIP